MDPFRSIRRAHSAISDEERRLVCNCAAVSSDYRDQVDTARSLVWFAYHFRLVPFLGDYFLRLTDRAVADLHHTWAKFEHAMLEVVEITHDHEFHAYAVDRVRETIDKDWPEPRQLRLPSDCVEIPDV